MMMPKRAAFCASLLVVAGVAFGGETIQYADEAGNVHSSAVRRVTLESLKELRAQILEGTRVKTVTIPSRRIVDFRRGDVDDVNQWSKLLAQAYRLMSVGQYLTTKDSAGKTTAGAEEVLEKVAYSTEQGAPGQQETEKVWPWQNMYAVRYLAEVRYQAGRAAKNADLLKKALQTVEEFRKRSEAKLDSRIDWEVPAEKGSTAKKKVYGWGENRLLPEVMLLKARVLREMGEADGASAAFDEVVAFVKKNDLSPRTLADALTERAEMLASGKSSEQAEQILRDAGNSLRAEVRTQKEPYGKAVLARAANQALLRGADLLLASAVEGKVSYDVPLARYRQLRDSEGKEDPALAIGASAGIGVCLAETKKGREAYEALLDVVVRGYEYPELMPRALYYLGVAAPLFADEVDKAGGKGQILREEGGKWWLDLKERFPASPWSEKAK